MTNEEIKNVNDRELFSELFDNPINPLLTHIVPPFVDKKDPSVPSTNKRRSNLEMERSLWAPERTI